MGTTWVSKGLRMSSWRHPGASLGTPATRLELGDQQALGAKRTSPEKTGLAQECIACVEEVSPFEYQFNPTKRRGRIGKVGLEHLDSKNRSRDIGAR